MTINPATVGAICANRSTGTGIVGSDHYFGNTVALLHLDDDFGSPSNFIQNVVQPLGRGSTWAFAGVAQITRLTPLFGSGCANFTGVNGNKASSTSADYVFGTGDYTIEFAYWAAANSDTWMADFGDPASGPSLRVDLSSGATGRPYVAITNTPTLGPTAGVTNTLNAWNRIAFQRSGTTMAWWKEGVYISSVTDSTNFLGNEITLGQSGHAGFAAACRIDEVRVAKAARYIAGVNYTLATSAFPDF